MKHNRDIAIDYVKGFMVLVMVLYHSVNYYIGGRSEALKYIDFVTGSFVFIAGYLITNSYKNKYIYDESDMYRRLIKRGSKLLLMFTFLNVLANIMVTKNYNEMEFGINKFITNVVSIYIMGQKQHAIFYILLPISYLLFISVVLMKAFKRPPIIGIIIITIFILCVSMKEAPFGYIHLSIGLNGMLLGYIRYDISKIYGLWSRMLSFVAVIIYFAIIAKYGKNDVIYFYGIFTIIVFVYINSIKLNYKNRIHSLVVTMGKYSLVSYLSQIFILQLLYRFSELKIPSIENTIVVFMTTTMVVYVLCVMLSFVRSKSKVIDELYVLVFN